MKKKTNPKQTKQNPQKTHRKRNKNREKCVKVLGRNTSSYFSCNDDTVLQFYRRLSSCWSDDQLAGLHARLRLVVPKKPLCISRGHCCNRKMSLMQLPLHLIREVVFFCRVISLKTTIPLCTGDALSDYPAGTKMSKTLPDWCWSHPGRPKWARHQELHQPPQRCVCHQAHLGLWAYLGTNVSAAFSFEHRDVYAESGLLLRSCVQLEAVILQRALCERSEFIVGMQLSITATAGLGSSFDSFNIIVVF